MQQKRRSLASKLFFSATVSSVALGLAGPAIADTYPSKPIKFMVAWAPGGATDQIARILAQPLSQALGVSIVVENKGGAGGNIGTAAFVKEKADGYAILLTTSSTHAAGPHLYKSQGFDVHKDFTPVGFVASVPNVMVVPTSSPWNSIKDIVNAAKKEPGKYTYGSAGIGGSQHLAGANFKTITGVDIRHVPYKGSGPAAVDLIAGHIDMMVDTGSLGSVRAGRLKPLAVASRKRLEVLPNVPTFAEAGFPMLASAWYGVMLPANAPADVVARLNRELNKALQNPDVRKKLIDLGAEIGGGSADEFGKFAAAEIKRYEGIVRDSGAPKE
jgi:tripartite-type tricarboxylate transporter receptor subunit TctC